MSHPCTVPVRSLLESTRARLGAGACCRSPPESMARGGGAGAGAPLLLSPIRRFASSVLNCSSTLHPGHCKQGGLVHSPPRPCISYCCRHTNGHANCCNSPVVVPHSLPPVVSLARGVDQALQVDAAGKQASKTAGNGMGADAEEQAGATCYEPAGGGRPEHGREAGAAGRPAA